MRHPALHNIIYTIYYLSALSTIYLHYLLSRFVILHGTDTLAYTSSALSFMLENLGKPVSVTMMMIMMMIMMMMM